MKNAFKKTILAMTIAAMTFVSAACARPQVPTGGGNREQADAGKTQIWVYSYDGGYGNEWLTAAKRRYEAARADVEYEPGKKGVQIMIDADKTSLSTLIATLRDDRNEIFFHENGLYSEYVADGLLADISAVYEDDLSEYGDPAGTTLKDKLTEAQLDYYGRQGGGGSDGETHYYALPYYSGYSGFVYDVDMFDEYGYYFRGDLTGGESLQEKFIGPDGRNKGKSLGPDGEPDTADDGLPATYDEFYTLCDYITQISGQIPLIWSGRHYPDYFQHILHGLFADADGYEQASLLYTLDGMATNLGTVTDDGVFTRDSSPTRIDVTNGYEMARSEGLYHALDFIHELVSHSEWQSYVCTNSGFSNENTQQTYLWSRYQGADEDSGRRIAMMLEGIWWEEEARNVFDNMAHGAPGEEYSRENRRFAFMPYPKYDASASKDSTLLDFHRSLCFVNGNVSAAKMPLIIDFLKFLHTDESLNEFTSIVNAPLSYKYEMTEENLAKMTNYGKSVLDLVSRSQIVYPLGMNSVIVNNESGYFGNIYDSEMSGQARQDYAARFFYDYGDKSKAAVKKYFDGILTARRDGITWPTSA